MAQINQLPVADQANSSQQIPVYVPNSGDTRRLSLGALLEFFQQEFASPSLATNVYTPGTGFNISVPTPVAQQQWVLLQPAGTLAAGTVTLPLNTQTPDGTEVLVTTTQAIASFSVGANGAATANGVPTTLAANSFFRLRFVGSMNSWYRIG